MKKTHKLPKRYGYARPLIVSIPEFGYMIYYDTIKSNLKKTLTEMAEWFECSEEYLKPIYDKVHGNIHRTGS